MRKFYVNFFAVLCLLLISALGQAQLTGTKTIPGDYATVAAAATDLNALGVGAGGVVFNVAAGHTEISDVPVITASGTVANTIIFQKSGAGANPKITPLTGGTVTSTTTLGSHGDGIVVINGGDYITFDGIDLETNAAFTSVAMYEYGYYLKKASATDACKNVTIKNCAITLNKAAIYSFGIFVSNISGTAAVTVTATGGRSENIKIFGNTITNAYGGIQLRGFAASSPYDLYDQNIEVGEEGANIISNYGGGTTTAYGIYGIYQENIKIANNNINNTANGGAASANTLYGIFLSTGTNSTVSIHHNTVSITGGGTTQSVYAINNAMGSTGTTNTVSIYNNTVTGCSYPTSTSGDLYLIYQNASAFKAHLYNNTVTSNTLPSASGILYCLYQSGSVVNEGKIYGNSVTNNTKTGTGSFYCIYNSPSATSTNDIYDNSVSGNSGAGTLHGMYSSAGLVNNISKNRIFNISSSTATGVTNGITVASGPLTTNIFNNFISDLKAPDASATTDAIRGINITSTTSNSAINLYYNTVYLNASSSGANFSTAGVYHTYSATATTAALTMKNNVIINQSSANGTGLATAFRRSSSTSLLNFAESNNNDFYAGTPAPNHLIYYDGTNSDQTLVEYKNRVAPRDANSISELPPFINIAVAPFDLHINTAIPTQLESGGTPVTGITTDFDGNTRNASTPDMGADEFNGLSADLTAPGISYTALSAACATGNRTLSGVTITDASGVSTAGALVPRIYYRKNAGGWFSQPGTLVSGTGTNGNWDFSILSADMGGLALGDIVSYYIIAQDLAGTPNIASNPAGVIATNVNTVTTHPPVTETYVVGANLSGTYAVGASGTFKTLTNAVDAYNGCPVAGAVTFNLVDALYSTNETFPITINANPAASAVNTLTLQPQLGINVIISGSSGTAPAALIRLNAAKYVTIDGLNTAGNNLVIENTSSSAGSAVIWLSSNGAGLGATNNTIRNTTIKAGVTQNTATTVTYGIVIAGSTLATSVGSTTAGEDNDNNLVQENLITKVRYGLYIRGGSTTNPNTGTIINGNTFGPTAFGTESIGKAAILIREESGTQITGNTIQFIGGDYANTPATGTDRIGIAFGTDASWTPTAVFVKNAEITDNIIHDIVDERTFSAVGIGMGAQDGSNATGNLVANNMIFNIKANGTGSDQAIGIGVSAGNTDSIVYNSIYMTGDVDANTSAATPTVSSFGITITSGSAVSNPAIINNIVHMDLSSSSAPTLKNAAINVPASFAWGTGRSNYNDLYATAANTQAAVGAVGGSGGTFYTTLANWQTAVSQDANSLSTLPVFVSATDLHLVPASNGIINNQGTPIPGITTDIDGDTRNVTNPDIGADEFVGPSGDVTPPNILYATLSDTCVLGNRNLQATITDVGGIPVSGALQPRIYYRKNAGAWFSSQGILGSGTGTNGTWNFVIVAADMGGLASNDVVQYFVIAQDLANNIASNPSAGLVAANVNTVTTAPTTPASYTVLPNLAGTYTVGAGGNFTTLTAAINAYNNYCVSGAVVFELTDALYSAGETFPITINQNIVASSTNTLTIRPATGVAAVVTGSSTTGALIDFNGADYVTINGVNAAGSSLIIRNTSTTIPVIRFINDATHNTITNSIIEGSVTSTTNGQILFSTSASGTTGNSNNSITNNIIRDRTDATAAFGVGIYSSGTTAASNQDNAITGNHLLNFTSSGVNVAATGNGNGWNISNNHFYNNLTPSTTQSGITIASAGTGITISNNFIGGNAPGAAGVWTNSGNVAVNAINITNGVVTISNNTIANITTTNTGTTARTRGINFTSSLDNSVIQGNTIHSLLSSGAVTSYTAGSQAAVGIHYFPSGFHTLTVRQNTIYNISIENTSALTTSNIAAGMVLTNMGGSASENRIYDIRNKSTGTTAGQPPIATGMYIRFLSGTVVNNMIAVGTGENNNVQYNGILVAGGTVSNTAAIEIYYNTVQVAGTATGANSSYAFLRGDNTSTSALQTVTLRNNIFSNTRSGGGSSNYAIGNQGTEASLLWSSNYNNLYSSNANTIGYFNATGGNLAGWQGSSAGDANSISVLPVFVSATDLHLVAGINPLINNAGTPVTGVTTDFDGETRNATTPDIGADEFTPSVSVDFSAFELTAPVVKNCYTNAETVKLTIRNNSSASHDFSLLPVTVNVSVTGPNPVSFTPVIVNTGVLAAGATLEVQITASYDMSAPGTYTFNANTQVAGDVNTGNDAMAPVNRTVSAVIAGTVSSSNSSFCVTPGTPTLTLAGSSAGTTIQWQQSTGSAAGPWTNVGTSTSTFTPATPVTATTWYQAVVSCGAVNVTSNTVTVTFNNPLVLTTTGASSCGSGSVTLQATASAGANLSWYNVATGGTVLGNGTTFTTPSLTNSTTYYVTASSGSGGLLTTGLPATLGSGTSGAGTTNFGLVFDVFSAFTLESVTIYPIHATAGTPGTVTIDVINGAGTVVHTATFNVIGNPVSAPVPQTVTLNFNLAPGTNYKLRPGVRTGITGLLFEPSAAAPGGNYGYPFTVPGVLSITSSTLTAAPTNTPRPDLYYYFYNWKIGAGCESARVPVVATIDPPTVGGTTSANQSICVGQTPADIALSGQTGSVVKWQRSTNPTFTSPVDIAVTSATLTGAQIGPLAATTYFRAVVQSGACAPANSSVVTITVANPTATIAYANSPYCIAAGTATVSFTGTPGGSYAASPTGLSINASTGAITLGSSNGGTYTVTYSIAASGGCPAFSTSTTVTISAAGTWLGVTNSDWNTASNWCGGIPTSATDVVIPSAAPNMPNLSTGSGTARNLNISNGGSVTIGTGGIFDLFGNISGAGTFTATNGSISFRGSANQATPGISATNITMNGGGGWTPAANSTVSGLLTLTNGHITLGSNNLSIQNSSVGSIASHIIVNGTGRVVVSNLAANSTRVVPVGIDAGSYNPVTLLANTGHTTDNFTVGVQPGVFVNGNSGTTFTTHVVNRMWSINESTAGGSNVNVTLQWTAGQELPNFNRAKSYVMQHNGTSWLTAPEIAASGNDPYTQTRQSVTSFGSFAVQTQPIPRPVTGIYPNPTRSQLNVVIDLPAAQKVTLTVYDAAGKLVKQYATNLNAGLNLYPMQVYDLSAGVYFIKVSIVSNPEFMLTRFVKE